MNRLNVEKQKAVILALVEGSSINSTVRMTGVSKPTILKLIRDLGHACMGYHDTFVRGLKPATVQVDEIWAFCYAKQKNVPPMMQGEYGYGDVWTWTGITDQKLIIAYHVGLHGQADADMFMRDLAGRITNRTQLTSDGHTSYLNAVESAFGSDVHYAQLVKTYGSSAKPTETTAEAKYSPPKINGAKKTPIIGLPAKALISTSHVERSNLTIRMGMRRFTRLTNAHSKKVMYHEFSVSMYFMFYNYCRVHSTIGTSPAVASGLTDHVWKIEELIGLMET
jgi:hypothetical protein